MIKDGVRVSVVCFSYNHVKYIARALDSIVSQKTTFPFEILIHDDASTDGTVSIIREYAEKYSNIVPIIEPNNCYQNGIDYHPSIAKQISGKYVALCECDDWWCDDLKLQRQFDYMEENPNCSLCVHGVRRFSWSNNRDMAPILPSKVAKDYSTDEIVRGDGGLFGTNSMFFRSENYLLPELYKGWGVGDYPRTIYLSTCGRVHFEPDLMSVYQVLSEGSWSSKMRDPEFFDAQEKSIVQGLERFDKSTNGEFHDSVEFRKIMGYMEYVSQFGSISDLFDTQVRERLRYLPASRRMKYLLRIALPSAYSVLARTKDCIQAMGL